MRTEMLALVLALAVSGAGVVRGQQPASPAPTPQPATTTQEPSAKAAEAREPEASGEEETVRVRHRVVFVDALVRDKRTNAPAADLKEENFEILSDGRPRKLAYFSREGDAARKPLALTLVLDLRRGGSGRYLRRPDIMQAMAAELSKLPPQDEVAVIVLNAAPGGQRRWLTPFTRDRAQTAAALALVPSLVPTEDTPVSTTDGHDSDVEEDGPTFSATFGGGNNREKEKGGEQQQPSAPTRTAAATTADNSNEAGGASPVGTEAGPRVISVKTGDAASNVESEIKMVGKDGSVVTRTVYKNGQVRLRRVSKKGEVDMELAQSFDVAGAVHEVVKVSGRDRPEARAAMVWISDGIVPVFYVERDVAVAELALSNVTFSALVTDMKFGFKLFKPVLKPLGNVVGLGIYGTSQHVARETGGEAMRVNRPADYASGLAKIIGNLTGRYSLGFALADDERDDGRMHQLEVRVRARDAKGKERKLTVVTRRGFYLPREAETAQSAAPVAGGEHAEQKP